MLLPALGYAQPNNYDSSESIKEQMQLGIERQLNGLGIQSWDKFIREIQEQGNPLFSETSTKDMLKKIITGDFDFDVKGLWLHIIKIFYSEITANLELMAKIIALAVICGILNNMQDSFQNVSTAEAAYFVCYLVVVFLIIQSIVLVLEVGRRAVDNIVSFTQILFPILLALLISVGGVASSAILSPTVGLMAGFMGTILRNVMFPLILCSTVIVLVNHISDKVQLNRLSALFKNVCEWLLGIIFTVFVGALTVQGVMAASIDGISIRTAKFAVDAFVPIVGGMFAQAVDMVVGCSLLIKNAVGLMGLLVIAFICLYPVLKILCIMAVYKISSAILEPVTDKRISDCLNDIGNILIILAITVSGMAIMFFLAITLIIGVGNAATMMR
jgi:stage III sporulation protein AE